MTDIHTVVRGCSWYHEPGYVRASYMFHYGQEYMCSNVGFRCVRGLLPILSLRGGSWSYEPRYARGSFRFRNEPAYRNNNVGFRCVKVGDSRVGGPTQ